ncbi:hypothetical protein L873DRAFT_1191770 [Choiromyces venosus 120613-1]|uniref:Uncharacterized protein n=1 Tax=Choiromyces venosus 120613-1 TaxID=1336337 RepID=A0A3N4JF57_9PEZI|nr:hypothetical protein L873DRAFT_1191770 [Choiromyces venosus 120613-1]
MFKERKLDSLYIEKSQHYNRICSNLVPRYTLWSNMSQLRRQVRLLRPTGALLIFPSEEPRPIGIFVFVIYKKLAQYHERTLEEKQQYQKRKEAGGEKEAAREVEEEKSGAVEKEKLGEMEWESEMEEGSSEDGGGSCEESEEEMNDQSMENS